ncbi:hypothetical protein [Actinomycetospora aeridis]|uniref:Uncharacterized protein n=1 Tax=Actinomycetospora aeridis TaxID=3129231 RepID=A0ABU8N3V5_9PSEU
MDFRRLPVLAGPFLAGLLVLGGCAGAPETPVASPAPTPAASAPAAGGGQAPCTTRLRPGGATGGGTLRLTPEAQEQIEQLRRTPNAEASEDTRPDPELAARLAEVGSRVERAAQPCTDR